MPESLPDNMYIFVRLFQTNFETPEASNMAELYSKKKTPYKQTSTKQMFVCAKNLGVGVCVWVGGEGPNKVLF